MIEIVGGKRITGVGKDRRFLKEGEEAAVTVAVAEVPKAAPKKPTKKQAEVELDFTDASGNGE